MSKATDQSKQFYDTLLKVSRALISSHTRQELLKSILQEVKPLFNYHSAGLFVVYEKEDYHIDLTAKDPEIEPSDINYTHRREGNVQMNHRGSSVQYAMQQAEVSNGVALLDYADLHKKFPDYPQFQDTKKDGYRDCLVGLLNFQGKTLGMFCINAMEKGFFPEKKFELFKVICDQLAIAINNILDKEAIEREKAFTDTLLHITEMLATINTGRELLSIIVNEVKPIFSFYDIGLFVYNKNKTQLEDWAIKYEEFHLAEANRLMHFDETINKPLAVAEGTNMSWQLDLLQKAGRPVVIDLEEMAKEFPEYEQSEAILKVGYRDSMQTLLRYGGEILGFFCINVLEKGVYSEKHFSLFQPIADQIAVAVSNLLANEEIRQREQEKTRLLALSEPISKVRNRKELLQILYNHIREIFPFDDTGLFTLDDSGEHHIDWIVEDELTQEGSEIKEQGITGFMPHKG